MAVMYSQNGVIVRRNSTFDVIGGKKYKTVKMPDGKIWLAENLDFKFCNIGGRGELAETAFARYYNNDESTYGWNGNKYGLLYNWPAAKFLNDNRTELCPGWRLPSKGDIESLISACGGMNSGNLLKSKTGWNSENGTDTYGFNIYPSGAFYSDTFTNLGEFGSFSTSTLDSETTVYTMFCQNSSTIIIQPSGMHVYRPIRLVRDSN